MKKLCIILWVMVFSLPGYMETIDNLPAGTYNNLSFTTTQKTNVENLSSAFRGLPKINGIYSWYVSYGLTNWPAGSWGRGYHTWPGWTHSTYWNLNDGVYRAHHPLMRDCSAFFRGHLHLYLSGHAGNNLSIIQAGVDYILSEQITSGGNAGGFIWWNERDGQTDINMSMDIDEGKNYPELYEASYALAALSEYYLSGINYKRTEVRAAILLTAQYIANLNWENHSPGIDNGNIRGLALWGLSAAYKAIGECFIMYELKILVNWFITEQISSGPREGEWPTGGNDEAIYSGCPGYHDTKIFYHFFMIRGLVEAFDAVPDQDSEFKTQLVTCLKRSINHVINKRLASTSPTNPNLYYWHMDNCGNVITTAGWNISDKMDVECWVDAMAKITYYSRNSVHFTSTERTNLKNLTNKLASGLNSNEKWHICAIGSYLHYMTAVNNGTNINMNWLDPNMHYTPAMITGRVVSGDFDNDGQADDMAAFYDYGVIGGNSKTALHVWRGETDHFDGPYSDGWWLSTSFTANQITGKVVSGDFDHDGYKDDIAALYDMDGNQTKVYVWRSNGSSFTIHEWWYGASYSATQITDKVVSGDFDRDGWWDDIAAFYEVGPTNTRMHVFCSNTNSFTVYDGWWSSTSYASSKIAGRVVSGDFDADNINDDIAAFYDNGSGNASIDFWTSNGGGVYTKTNIWNTAYDVSKINKRVVSGDFDNDNRLDDIAAFYDVDGTTTRVHVWKMNNISSITWFSSGWWNSVGYYASMVTGRVVSGNFNSDGSYITDIGMFPEYGSDNMRVHVLVSNGTAFNLPTSSSWWLPCWWYPSLSGIYEGDHQTTVDASIASQIIVDEGKDELVIYPNPSSGLFYVDRTNPVFNQIQELSVYDSQGKIIYSTVNQFEQFTLSNTGIYYVTIKTFDGRLFNSKIIVI